MTAVYLNFLTECSHIDHCPFLVGPYMFFKSYHLTCMAIIQVIIMIICDNHPVEHGHQCGTTLYN